MRRKPKTSEAQFDLQFEKLRKNIAKDWTTNTGLTTNSVIMIRQSLLQNVLLDYQLDWIDDPSDVKIWEKSRRIGASWAEAAASVLYAASETGSNVWYISYNKDMTAGFIEDCVYWVKQYSGLGAKVEDILDDEDKDILGYKIRFASGNTITALSSKASNLRSKGKPGEILIVDEAAFVEDLSSLMKASIAFMVWGGSIHLLSTHNGETNAFNSLILDSRAGKNDYKVHRTTLRDAVRSGLVKKVFKVLGRVWSKASEIKYVKKLITAAGSNADEEYGVVPSQGSGTVLSRAIIERCMSDELPVLKLQRPDDFKTRSLIHREMDIEDWLDDNVRPLLDALPKDRRCYAGLDFGRTGDLSVLCPGQDDINCTLCIPFVVEMRNIPHTSQWQVVQYVFDRLPMFGHGAFDARGNGSYLAEVAVQKYGQDRITEVMPTEKWYREEMQPYISRFDDGTITLPKDAGVLDDHRCLQKINGVVRVPEKKAKDRVDGGQRHGDTAIAGALVEFASRQDVIAEFDFESTDESCVTSGNIF